MSIDVVITWVDGCEELHLKKRKAYLDALQKTVCESKLAERLNAFGELDFCLASIFRFIPWIGKVYIVTDAQVPKALESFQNTPYADRIELVDHQVIFQGYEQYLPTFNSLAIESMLWRIPGLSEQFIYFNDDCMLLKPLREADFFDGDKLVLRGGLKLQSPCQFWRLKKTASHRMCQENAARLLGYHRRFIYLHHTPFPLKKKILKDFFEMHQPLLHKNLKHRLRDLTQFWSVSLAYHLAWRERGVVWDKRSKAVNIHAARHTIKKMYSRLKKAEQNKNTTFICVQSLSEGCDEAKQILLDWLNQEIGCIK